MIGKVYYLFLALFFCSLTLTVRGQNALEETIQKNVELKKGIESLEKDSIRINGDIVNINSKNEEESKRNGELEKTYASLMASTSQDAIIRLRHEVDSLENRQKSLQASITSAKKKLGEKKLALQNADSELQDLDVYSEIQQKQTYESNKLYLRRRYSLVSLEKLAELYDNADQYKSFVDFADYKKRIAAALNNKRVFDRGWECVNAGTNYQNMVELRRSGTIPVLEIKKDNIAKGIYKLSTEQFNEMDSLDIKLSRINDGIKELKNVIARVNSDKKISEIRKTKKSNAKKECLDHIRQYIIPEEGSEGARVYERYFKMIPYLEKLLRDYWKELKADPFNTPTKTEKTIINLVVR